MAWAHPPTAYELPGTSAAQSTRPSLFMPLIRQVVASALQIPLSFVRITAQPDPKQWSYQTGDTSVALYLEAGVDIPDAGAGRHGTPVSQELQVIIHSRSMVDQAGGNETLAANHYDKELATVNSLHLQPVTLNGRPVFIMPPRLVPGGDSIVRTIRPNGVTETAIRFRLDYVLYIAPNRTPVTQTFFNSPPLMSGTIARQSTRPSLFMPVIRQKVASSLNLPLSFVRVVAEPDPKKWSYQTGDTAVALYLQADADLPDAGAGRHGTPVTQELQVILRSRSFVDQAGGNETSALLHYDKELMVVDSLHLQTFTLNGAPLFIVPPRLIPGGESIERTTRPDGTVETTIRIRLNYVLGVVVDPIKPERKRTIFVPPATVPVELITEDGLILITEDGVELVTES